MNKTLTNQIVKHILTNLGILDSRPVSLISDEFLTDLQIEYENIEDKQTIANVWATEALANNIKIQLAATKFEMDNDEFAVIIEIENCPTYGCYFENENDINSLIAFSLKGNAWIPADIYTQATFLAGMEQLKDLTASFSLCKNPQLIYDKIIGFVNFRDEI